MTWSWVTSSLRFLGCSPSRGPSQRAATAQGGARRKTGSLRRDSWGGALWPHLPGNSRRKPGRVNFRKYTLSV